MVILILCLYLNENIEVLVVRSKGYLTKHTKYTTIKRAEKIL